MCVTIENSLSFVTEKRWNSTRPLACVVREGHAVCIRYGSHVQNNFPLSLERCSQSCSSVANADAFELQRFSK